MCKCYTCAHTLYARIDVPMFETKPTQVLFTKSQMLIRDGRCSALGARQARQPLQSKPQRSRDPPRHGKAMTCANALRRLTKVPMYFGCISRPWTWTDKGRSGRWHGGLHARSHRTWLSLHPSGTIFVGEMISLVPRRPKSSSNSRRDGLSLGSTLWMGNGFKACSVCANGQAAQSDKYLSFALNASLQDVL